MNKQRGFTVMEAMIVVMLFLFIILPYSCHKTITTKQKIMAKAGVEMTYWDIIWVNPDINFNQGEIRIKEDK